MDDENENKDVAPVYQTKKPEEEPKKPSGVEAQLDKESAATRAKFVKETKDYWDVNMAWPMMIIIILAIFGIGYAFQKSEASLSSGYFILFLLVTGLACVIVYNLGKILFGAIAGYKVSRIEVLGIEIVFGEKKAKTRFLFRNILEFHMNMTPRLEDDDPKPALMLWGGTIVYAIAAIAVIAITFLPSMGAKNGAMLRYGTALGALIVFYEMVPCRLDTPNDMFLLFQTSKPEDRTAYNNYLRNEYKDALGEMPLIQTWDSYEHSKIKPLDLLPQLHQKVYANDYEGALKICEAMKANDVPLTDRHRCEEMYEELYLFLTHGRSTESEKLTVKLDHQLKKTADFNPSLSALRSEVLISGLVDNNLDDLNSALNDFKDELVFTGKTERALKDLSLVNAALKRVQQAHPDWKINPFGDPWAKKETEKDEED